MVNSAKHCHGFRGVSTAIMCAGLTLLLSPAHLRFRVKNIHVGAPHNHHLALCLIHLPHLCPSVLQQQRAIKQVTCRQVRTS